MGIGYSWGVGSEVDYELVFLGLEHLVFFSILRVIHIIKIYVCCRRLIKYFISTRRMVVNMSENLNITQIKSFLSNTTLLSVRPVHKFLFSQPFS